MIKEFIDHTYFLGMNHKNNKIRIFCKNFFISKLDKIIYISLENIGKIDNVIWSFPKEKQSGYFPFMDALNTDMNIGRIGYSQKDLDIYKDLKNNILTESQKLTLAMTIANSARLFTLDEDLLALGLKFVKQFDESLLRNEQKFPEELEILYQKSLTILI